MKEIIKLIVLKVMVKYKGVGQNLISAGSNSEAIQHITLKLTTSECLNRHHVRTKFCPNP